jgi:predicted O-linked N-acetylglucosamine transferase (SPINDLY family)
MKQNTEPPPDEVNALLALYNARHYAELENRARSLLELYPDAGLIWQVFGISLHMQCKDSLFALQKTAQLLPDDAGAHNNLGNALHDLRQLDGAAAAYRIAVELKPDFAMAHNNLGNVLKDIGQYQGALESYRRALVLKPGSAEMHFNMAVALQSLGQLSEAVVSYRRVLEIEPNFAEAHNNLGNILTELWQLNSAVESYRRALQLKPDYVKAYSNLGNALTELGQLNDAVANCSRALELKPDFADAHINLGNSFRDLGQHDDAVASYRRALDIKPDLPIAHSNLLFCLNHKEDVDAQTLFAEHCRFAEQFEAPLRANWPQHSNSRNPERCLQVGFVSADLRNHPVAHFFEPVLDYLARYPHLSLHAYYNHTIEDSVTQRLQGYFANWHTIAGLPDDALAQKIRDDGIDILYDLSGHTGKHRLLTFARKPAPVQVSWIGYPGTTGLSSIDYYFADRFLSPPGQLDNQFTEKIVHLPANAPFLPSKDAPPVNALPAMSNGFITFGSFNRPSKISRSVIALWAQLLRALPDSRMLLGAMSQDSNYNTLIEFFAQEGIARDRLSFHVRSDMDAYLGLHQQVDICLDTFPYNGGTTTCHALWMGIPTLTLAEKVVPGRQGAAVMGHVGLDAFVAHNAADFVQKGLSCAGNLVALSDIRMGLRERFAKSAMGQPAVVAEGVERALRIMWQRWCAGLPAESFEVSWQDIDSTIKVTDQ